MSTAPPHPALGGGLGAEQIVEAADVQQPLGPELELLSGAALQTGADRVRQLTESLAQLSQQNLDPALLSKLFFPDGYSIGQHGFCLPELCTELCRVFGE